MISNAQTPYYYYYEGKKQYLSLNTKCAFLSMKDQQLPSDIKQRKAKVKELKPDQSDKKQYQKQNKANRFYTELNFEDNLSDEQYLKLLSDIKSKNKNVIVSPYFKNKTNDTIGLSNFFYVKLKTIADTTLLKQMAEKTNCVIMEQDTFMPLWFVLSTSESSDLNAMECSNVFYESGIFQAAEPNLMVDVAQCANDIYFPQQWGLRNTGQYGGTNGVDIKACDAWALSRGNNVTVAVIDQGIELNHPDLARNISTSSYDTENRTSPSIVRGDHATAVAGILGAVQNNSLGVSGVAPNCRLMSISSSFDATPLSRMNRADGINWAWQKGADVISNSWSSSVQYQVIDDAIYYAVTQGRGGKGCVVVFCSQNQNYNSVVFPASLPNVIAVGAIDRCGIRSGRIDIVPNSCDPWSPLSEPGSNYGSDLNVVAPGTNVYTTDRQGNAGYNTASGTAGDYSANFGGTSAACPHVAGVAALILSVRPDLTPAEVRKAIESTCTKVNQWSSSNPSGYVYSTNSTHPNGTWNNEVGYGLVNAYKAVSASLPITGPSVICPYSYGTYTVVGNIYNDPITWSCKS